MKQLMLLALLMSFTSFAQTWQTIPNEHFNVLKYTSGGGLGIPSANYSQFEINSHDGSMWFISNHSDTNFNIKRIKNGTMTLFNPSNMPYMDMNSRSFYGIDFSSNKTYLLHRFDGAFSFDGANWNYEEVFNKGTTICSDGDTVYFGRENDSIITLSGYYYHFIAEYEEFLDENGINTNPLSTPLNFWYPINPSSSTPKMAFSIYITDDSLNSQYDFPCFADNNLIDSFASVYQYEKPLSFELFPNPGTNQLSIRLPGHSKGNIFLHDVTGRLIHEIKCTQNTLYFIDTKDFNRGIYFVTYESEGLKSSQKWIKQ